jgi:alpha-beta hydrolase superfamily lysophospholipase
LTQETEFLARMQQEFGATVDDVALTATDGAALKAWFVQPPQPNGKAVVLLHGIADNREGIAGFGDMFLR